MEEKKKFQLFGFNKNKKEIDVEAEDRTPTLKFFFKLLWRRMPRLVSLNFLISLFLIPIFVCVYLYFSAPKTPTALSPLYSPLYTVSLISDSPAVHTMLSTVDAQIGFPTLSPGRIVAIVTLALFVLLTWGLQNVGTAYVLRGFFRGDPVFILSDFIYAIKRNWKQALTLGTFDLIIIAVLIVDFLHYSQITGSYWNDIMYCIILAISVLYFFMRFYLYQLMITFEMKWNKILKNALIFSALGVKRNLMAALGILFMVLLNGALIFLFFPISIPIILPFFYLFSFSGFMTVYAAYPVIDRYLIKPYHTQNSEEDPDEETSNLEASDSEGPDQ